METREKNEKKKKSVSEITMGYIKEHPHIKNCLTKGLINYSALSRLIAKELNLDKKTKKEAILIAARRFYDKVKEEPHNEESMKLLLSNSELDIKNKINVFILEKNIDFRKINKLQEMIQKTSDSFYLLEGSNNFTLIIPERYSKKIIEDFDNIIIKHSRNLVLINIKSSQKIEEISGVIAFLTSLFSENGVNILEFFSCWTDTIFIIDEKDLKKTLDFLDFDKI